MLKTAFTTVSTYSAPSLREVKTSIESGFAMSGEFGADDYKDGNLDW